MAPPSPAAAAAAAAAAADSPFEQQQEEEQQVEAVPRGPIPTSFLVLAEVLDGSLCPLINGLAQQLVQQLLLLYEEHPCLFPAAGAPSEGPQGAPSFSLEVEGRLGVIREKDSGARLQLPLATHAVLQPSFCVHAGETPGDYLEGAEGPQARFVAGVSAAQFTDLKGLLLSVAVKNARAAEQRLQAHLALMGIEPSGAPLGGPSEDSEEEGVPPPTGGPPSVARWQLSGDDWKVLSEKETEENYFHIPALQAAARFSSLKGPPVPGGPSGAPQGPRGGSTMGLGGPGGPPASVQSLSQLLASPGIYKKSLLQWNVYTGADKDEAFQPTEEIGGPCAAAEETAGRTRVDYRLAINFEHKIEVKELQKSLLQGVPMGRGPGSGGYGGMGAPSVEPQLRRFRLRQSLVHRSGLRIDLTKVQQQTKPSWMRQGENRKEGQGRWLYEVEVELHPNQIARAILHKQQTGDPRPLWCLCTTFLSLLRELAAPLNSPLGMSGVRGKGGPNATGPGSPSAEAEWADLGNVQATERERAAFKRFLSETLPLIGDYGYRAVAVQFEEKVQKKQEIVPPLNEFLKDPQVELKCLYTHNKSEVPGPWIPHRGPDGKVHLVEMKR